MLTYSLEKDGGESLYTQLYACIRRDILSGTLSPRQKLPSKRALAQHNNINLQENVAQTIPLASNGPNSGIGVDTANALTINESGTYKVDYYFSGSTSQNANITVEINQNQTSIGSTTIIKDTTANVDTDFIGSSINSFAAGDKITLTIESTSTVTVTPTTGTSAYLNIYKI